MNECLDRLFEENAKETLSVYSGKRVHYQLESLGYTVGDKVDGKIGICSVRDVCYSPELSCYIYDLLDEETGEIFCVSDFEVDLTIIEPLT